ncbi:MAG: CsbD family protein, partial [Novosphingobium sp.]|uniref:CsbD family protein n=1 Tax=Novosphingobium sp. TaxID=1874826 RepID=UPI001E11AAD1
PSQQVESETAALGNPSRFNQSENESSVSRRTSTSRSGFGVHAMDKDRIAGSIEQAKGIIKEGVGKATGNTKLVVEGETDQVLGKVQKAAGRLKDAARDAVKK